MTEKILRFRWLIIAVMVLTFVPKTVQAEVKNYTITDKDKPAGSGTDSDPYKIASAGNLYWFANEVNNSKTNIWAVLTADITVNNNVLDADGNLNSGNTDFYEWTPIGNSDPYYSGTFDGQGHTISGLYINKEITASESDVYIGLFSVISNGTIKNVGVEDSYFNVTVNSANIYESNLLIIGGVCGHNYDGTITNCYNTGTVCGTKEDDVIGGVCGSNRGSNAKITNCYNKGTVIGTKNADIGGVCGYNDETITNCYYLTDENGSPKGIGRNTYSAKENKIEGKSLTEFGNGSVAWLLNENATDDNTMPGKPLQWLQNIDVDASPVLKANTANGVCPIVVKDGNSYKNDTFHSYSELAVNADAGTQNLYSYHCTKCNADNKKVIKNITKNNDTDIEITKNGTEPWKTTNVINLTAATFYDAPVEFTTTGGVTFNFTRNANIKWATLCLPYKITTSNYTDKCKFYQLNSVGENKIVLGELSGEITAGTPVFVKSDNDFDIDFSISENIEVEMATVPTDQSATGGTLIGTFKEKELTTRTNANDLFIKENYMWNVGKVNKTMKVRPFRAYIGEAVSGGAPAPKLSITIDGEATAISDALDTLNDTNAEYYDINGRRISSLQKGVNIVKSGNKTRKVIIK